VNTLKKDWKPDLGIKHILLTIKCLLIVPNPESALNEEAGKLLLEDYDEYFSRAKLYTEVHARNKPYFGQQGSSSLSATNNNDNLVNFNSTSTINSNTTSNNNNNNNNNTSNSTAQPLDSNKTIANGGNVNNNTLDEPNMKMAKLSKDSKKNDKKKALKRL
jgi:ubiquitin-conjugating enzyme E2 S